MDYIALIIEDDNVSFRVTSKLLESAGIKRVLHAKDGKSGFEMAKYFSPDIIIADIFIPQLNGIECCKKIREFLPNSVLIIVSAYSELANISVETIDYCMPKLEMHDNLIKVIEEKVKERNTLERHIEEDSKTYTCQNCGCISSGLFNHFKHVKEESSNGIEIESGVFIESNLKKEIEMVEDLINTGKIKIYKSEVQNEK